MNLQSISGTPIQTWISSSPDLVFSFYSISLSHLIFWLGVTSHNTLVTLADELQLALDHGSHMSWTHDPSPLSHIISAWNYFQILTMHPIIGQLTADPSMDFHLSPYDHHQTAFIAQPSVNMSNPEDLKWIFKDPSDIEMEGWAKPKCTLQFQQESFLGHSKTWPISFHWVIVHSMVQRDMSRSSAMAVVDCQRVNPW